MDSDIDNRREQSENSEKLREAKLVRGKIQKLACKDEHRKDANENALIENNDSRRELRLNNSEDAQAEEEHQQDQKVELGCKDGNGEIPAEILEEERDEGCENDAA